MPLIKSQILRKISFWVVPVVLLAGTMAIKTRFEDILGTRTPYLLFGAVVIIITWYSGWFIGLLSNFVSTFIVFYYFVEPLHTFVHPPRLLVHIFIYTGQNIILAAMSYQIKKALQRSTEAENRMKLLVEQACDLLILRDKTGEISYISPKVYQIFGYTETEYKALSLENIVAPAFKEEHSQIVAEVTAVANAHRFIKFQIVRKDGTIRWLEGDLYNYLEQPGIHALVAHYRDVTERVKLETLKNEFLSVASHELKTPVTSVKASLQVLQRIANSNEALKSSMPFFEKANRQVNRLIHIIHDLLDVTRIQSGKLELDKSVFKLADLLHECADYYQSINTNAAITITGDPNLMIYADRNRLEQVISNLLSNALKYSPGNQNVSVNYQSKPGTVEVSVKDNGIGIEKDYADKIFDRFFRVEHTSQHYSGLGLGLYISAEVIKQHGGAIGVDSEPGKGARFWFTLPLDN